jgi:hypothetical protein
MSDAIGSATGITDLQNAMQEIQENAIKQQISQLKVSAENDSKNESVKHASTLAGDSIKATNNSAEKLSHAMQER